MKEIEFNLLTEPWVRVRRPDNTVQEVSLTDALLHAQDYVDLAGEMPTQDAAVLRLLLAVLFTVFSRVDAKGKPQPLAQSDDALERWSELWQLGHFPAEPVRDYLEQWKDRFWLFHPTHPFWQVPTLSNGIAFDGKKLNGERAESGNKTPLFQNISKAECAVLTYAQAARWLIYQNGYDERGGRPKAGNKPRHGVGWLGQIGFVAVKGKNLYETLLRNMAFSTEQDALQEKQLPCWEREIPGGAQGEPRPLMQSDDALERWSALWQLGHFPAAPVRDYLEQWKDRFWLFHPTHPFWQVPQAKIGTEYGAAKLNGEMSESSNKLRLFPLYAGQSKEQLSYPQAARWLLCVNGYDDTSAKPKGKGLPSVGAGWLGKIGFIQAQGDNLYETLMLNLTLLRDSRECWGESKPCWELEAPKSAERTEICCPDNPAQLLTLQSRRLLLHRTGENVDGFCLLGGDFFPRENVFAEQMTIWRTMPIKKNEPVVFVPCRHDPAKQFWREFPAVFCQDSGHRPGVVCWIEKLQEKRLKLLDPRRKVHFRISGVQYGDKDFFVNDSFSDSLTFQAGILDEIGRPWQSRIVREIERCEQTAALVGHFAQELAIAAGDRNENAGGAVRAQFYFAVDQPFRQWLQAIDPEQDDPDEAALRWQTRARSIAEKLGKQMVMEAGNAALKGRRIVVDKDKKTERTILYTSPKAYNCFRAKLWEIYPKTES